jgi:uncharacterized protein (TIGR03086 family)
MDSFEVLERSGGEFERRLRKVQTDDWSRRTPCVEWSVWDLVNHVIGGCKRYAMLLHGGFPDETNATRALDHLGDDPVGSFAAAAVEMTNAFREPGALGRNVYHPAGDRSGETLLEMRTMDFAVHAWDLARATGSDETLAPDLVVWLWDVVPAMVPELAEAGYFAVPENRLPADASLQTRLLHLTGRRA